MSALRRGTPPPVPAPRSPERQRLFQAQLALSAANGQATRIEGVRQKIDNRLFDVLEPSVRSAKKALEEAQELAPEQLVDAVLGGRSGGAGVARAEEVLRDAQNAVDDARQARRLLSAEAERAEIAIGNARRDLDAAISAVVAADPAKQAVVAEYLHAGRQVLRLARVLRTLGVNVARGVEHVGLVLRIGDVIKPGSDGASLFTPDGQWAAVLAALRDDPDAKLPGLPPAEDDAGDAAAEAA